VRRWNRVVPRWSNRREVPSSEITMAMLPLAFALALPGEVTDVASTVRSVSIHPSSALVTRRATLPPGDGRYRIRGLPATLAVESVRLRLDGAEANDLEVRPQSAARGDGEARLAALRTTRMQRQDEHDAAVDAAGLAGTLRRRIERLLDAEAAAHAAEVARGESATDAWSNNLGWLEASLRAARRDERTAAFAVEETLAAVRAIDAELGAAAGQTAATTHAIEFDVVALAAGPHECTIEYQVNGASWRPRYDLRADAALKEVALTYRAEVAQQTGEDWRDVEVWLSTAEPRRGVTGPEARLAWIDLTSPRHLGDWTVEGLSALGYVGDAGAATQDAEESDRAGFIVHPTAAAVEREGLSLRYRLPRQETIESRPSSTTVLVGHSRLAMTGQRVCTPSLDREVWIRGRTRNTSDWVMLPGPAAVFFGGDFVGPATIGMVRPGEEFTLHLGREAGLVVTRTHVEDVAGSAGLFGSRKEQRDRFVIELENLSALASRPDGAVTVEVREVLETSRDDHIEVELLTAKPAPSADPRFARDRAEKGVLTFEVTVARGAKSTIDWSRRITWPEDDQIDGAASLVATGGGAGGQILGLRALGVPMLAAAAVAAIALLRRRRAMRHALLLRGTAILAWFASVIVVAPSASAQTQVDSRIERVTVYGAGAMVEREAQLAGSGTFLVRDLPAEADPESVRVRAEGGEIVAVELQERRERRLPDAAIESLRARLQALQRELALIEAEGQALDALATHLEALLTPSTTASPANGGGGRPGSSTWEKEGAFAAERLARNQAERREHARALLLKREELSTAQQEFSIGAAADRLLRDVVIDAVATQGGTLRCTVSYLVGDAGWTPDYELRATRDLDFVDLAYRALVTQRTSEPWRDVALVLSTAMPRLGAEGPDPSARPLTVRARVERRSRGFFSNADAAAPKAEAGTAMEPAATLAPALRAPPFAAVANEGLSARFALPDRQSIEPHGDGQRVLVGRARMPLTVERWCVPAADTSVWLRGKATNSSPFTLLPGPTAVSLGQDFLGRGALALTPAGAEVMLHLGQDPFIAVERTVVADDRSTSSFSDDDRRRFAWRTTLQNLGAPSRAADGSVEVIVRESLPRARDERITVTPESAKPRLSDAADDRKAREESSLLTWRVTLRRGAEPLAIEWGYRVAFPEGLELVRSHD
jgi:uncharacterized protein (TIGR02231 family)